MRTQYRRGSARLRFVFLSLALALSPGLLSGQAQAASSPTFTFTNLGTLGGASTVALAINSKGQVVGRSDAGTPSAPAGTHAFLWDQGVMQDLGVLPGQPSNATSVATGINDSGTVVGYATANGPNHAFEWTNGAMTDLGTLSNTCCSSASGVNKLGAIVGDSTTAICNPGCATHAVLWSGGSMTDLGTLGGTNSHAYAINDAGQIVGEAMTSAGTTHAVMWSGGNAVDLGALGAVGSRATAINSSGQIVGRLFEANGNDHAFLWSAGVMQDLGAAPGAQVLAFGINDQGQVVGGASAPGTPPQGYAFIWSSATGLQDLNSLAATGTPQLNDAAFAINQSGQIIGRYLAGGVTEQGFILSLSAPPPPTLTANFVWSMASRFGTDPTTGIVTYPRTINPSVFEVDFNGCSSTGPAAHFTWSTSQGVVGTSTNCAGFKWWFPQGQQIVTLTVTDASGIVTASTTQQITVKDYLIVAIGDSVASGEGNPDVAGHCQIGPVSRRLTCEPAPIWQPQFPSGTTCSAQATCNENLQCHRSTISGPTVAALSLNSPTASITFLDLACSGASVFSGLLTPQRVNPTSVPYLVAPQLSRLRELTGGRQIDALTLSIGANDVGFQDYVLRCAFPELGFGSCPSQTEINAKLAGLGRDLDLLAVCISTSRCPAVGPNSSRIGLNLPASRVFLTQYHDPTRDASGNFCNEKTRNAYNSLLKPLNDLLAAKAQQYGWNFVNGIAAAFATHGSCSTVSWVRNLPDSLLTQGDVFGTLHPNGAGHQFIGGQIVSVVRPRLS